MKKTLIYALSLTLAGALAGCSTGDTESSAESATSSSEAQESSPQTEEPATEEEPSPDSDASTTSELAEEGEGNKPAAGGAEAEAAFDEETARKQLLQAIDTMSSYTMTYQQGDNTSGSDEWMDEYTFTQELTVFFDGENVASREADREDPIPGIGEVVLKDSMRFIAENAKLSQAGASPTVIEGTVPSGIPIPLGTDLVTCAQDGDFVTDSARLIFDPEKELLHHVDYVISTMDFTAESTTPGTAEDHLKCHVVWDFHEIDGSAVKK